MVTQLSSLEIKLECICGCCGAFKEDYLRYNRKDPIEIEEYPMLPHRRQHVYPFHHQNVLNFER